MPIHYFLATPDPNAPKLPQVVEVRRAAPRDTDDDACDKICAAYVEQYRVLKTKRLTLAQFQTFVRLTIQIRKLQETVDTVVLIAAEIKGEIQN